MTFIKNISYLLIFISQFYALESWGNICHVITDRKHYMINEIMFGSIIFENRNLDGKVLRLEFKNLESDEIAFETCVRFKKNVATFYIPISQNYKAGTYKLDMWACKTENRRGVALIHLGNTYVHIINNLSLNRSDFYDITNNITIPFIPDFYKSNVSKSSENIVHIKFSAADSLALIAGFDSNESLNITTLNTGLTQSLISSLADKIFISAFVADKTDQKKFVLLGLYSNQASKMFISNSNDSGSSIFMFDFFEGVHKFNLFGLNSNEIKFTNRPKTQENKSKNQISDYQWSEILQAAEDGKKRSDIHQYFDVNTISMKPPMQMVKNTLPKPFKKVNPTNYKKFADFQTFCKENSLELKFEKKNGKTVAYTIPPPRISHSYDAKWHDPLFIIDGKCVTDASIAAGLKHEDIKSLNIYLDIKEITPWVYTFGSNGVVEIETKSQSLDNPSIIVSGFQNPVELPQSIINSELNKDRPVLLSTHYWNDDRTTLTDAIIKVKSASHQKNRKYAFFFFKENKLNLTDVTITH